MHHNILAIKIFLVNYFKQTTTKDAGRKDVGDVSWEKCQSEKCRHPNERRQHSSPLSLSLSLARAFSFSLLAFGTKNVKSPLSFLPGKYIL